MSDFIPEGWRLCPDCNGEGVVCVMDANPDLTEHTYECERCRATEGIVPNEAAS